MDRSGFLTALAFVLACASPLAVAQSGAKSAGQKASQSATSRKASPSQLAWEKKNGVKFNAKRTMLIQSPLVEEYVVPDGVLHIGPQSFTYNEKLEKITLPEGLLSIGVSAFKGCSSLSEIELPESLLFIEKDAFAQCPNLKKIKLPSRLVGLGDGVFAQDDALTDIVVEAKAFTLQDGILYDVEKIRVVCALKALVKGEITLPDTVAYISNDAFLECGKITKISMSPSLIYIGDRAFKECHKIKSIILPNGMRTIGEYAFNKCSQLSMVAIPSSVYRVGKEAFKFSGGGELVIEVATDSPLYTELEIAYRDNVQKMTSTDHIMSITASDSDISRGTVTYDPGDENPLTAGENTESYTISDKYTGIGPRAFWAFNNLEKITIPDTIKSIGESTFGRCIKLEKVTLPSELLRIEAGTFAWCAKLKEVELPEDLEYIGFAAFSNCEALEEIEIPDTVTAIGDMAFIGCPYLVISISEECPIYEKLKGEYPTQIETKELTEEQGESLIKKEKFVKTWKDDEEAVEEE